MPGDHAKVSTRLYTATAPPGFDTILKIVGTQGLKLHAQAHHA